MKRTIDQWNKCEPKAMVQKQSEAACIFALQDAKADILELYKENLRLKNIARMIAYPCRGTHEEGYGIIDLSKLIQSAYTADQLWVEPEDR